MSEHETLMGRDERPGSPYPLWTERLMLLLAVVVIIVYGNAVQTAAGGGWLGGIMAYLLFPLFLLGLIETAGRWIQARLTTD